MDKITLNEKDIEKAVDKMDSSEDLKDFLKFLAKENSELKAIVKKTEEKNAKIKEALDLLAAKNNIEKPSVNAGMFLKGLVAKNEELIEKAGGKKVKAGAKDWVDSDWNITQKAGLGTPIRSDATTGSYLAPVEYSKEIIRVAAQASQTMNKVTRLPMNSRSIQIPREATSVSLTWLTDQTTPKSETAPTFSQITLTAETLAGWTAITEEFDEDTFVDFANYLKKLFSEAYGQEFDKQVLVADSDPFDGVIKASGTNVVTMGSGDTSFSDADFDDLADMIAAVPSGARTSKAAYYMNTEIFFNFLKKKNSNNSYIYVAPGNSSIPTSIWGKPVVMADVMPDNGDSNVSTEFVAFGDLSYVVWGDRIGIEFKTYDSTIYNMQYDEIFLRMRKRDAFLVAVPQAFAVLKTAAS